MVTLWFYVVKQNVKKYYEKDPNLFLIFYIFFISCAANLFKKTNAIDQRPLLAGKKLSYPEFSDKAIHGKLLTKLMTFYTVFQ